MCHVPVCGRGTEFWSDVKKFEREKNSRIVPYEVPTFVDFKFSSTFRRLAGPAVVALRYLLQETGRTVVTDVKTYVNNARAETLFFQFLV